MGKWHGDIARCAAVGLATRYQLHNRIKGLSGVSNPQGFLGTVATDLSSVAVRGDWRLSGKTIFGFMGLRSTSRDEVMKVVWDIIDGNGRYEIPSRLP